MYLYTQGLDMETVFTLPKTTCIGGEEAALPLREIMNRVKATYCTSIGVEFMFINDRYKCEYHWMYMYICIYVYTCIGTKCTCINTM